MQHSCLAEPPVWKCDFRGRSTFPVMCVGPVVVVAGEPRGVRPPAAHSLQYPGHPALPARANGFSPQLAQQVGLLALQVRDPPGVNECNRLP